MLEYGSTIVLVAGGHITPLAQDTLKARRIIGRARGRRSRRRVAGAGRRYPHRRHRRRSHVARAEGGARRAPARARASRCTISAPTPASRSITPIPRRPPPCRSRAAKPTPASSIDGAGLGSAIAANKIRGRARGDVHRTRRSPATRGEHNGANVLALGATLVSRDEAIAIVNTFLETPMREPRYIRRLAKIRDLETRARLMQNVDLQRLIQIIVEELPRPRRRRRRRAARCHSAALRVLSGSDARRPRRRRHPAGAARDRRRGRRRSRSMIDHTLLEARRDAQGHRGAVPRSRRVQVCQRLRQPDLGRRCARSCCRAASVVRLLGGRLSAGRDDARRQALRDTARDLRRRRARSTWSSMSAR